MGKSIGKEIVLLLAFFGAIWAIVAYFSDDGLNDYEVIPDNLQEQLGDFMLEDIKRNSSLELIANDSFSLESWNEILERLDFENSKCRAIYITKNSEINAFTLPGDNIIIYSGLIDFIESSEELVGVLAHELGHVENDHVEELIAQQFALATLLMIISGDGSTGLFLEFSDALFKASFSRDNEKEADEYGLKLLEKGNLPADGMLRFFEKLDEEQPEIPELLSAFSSHPLNEERIQYIENHINKTSGSEPMHIDWDDFKVEMLELAGHSD